MTETSSEPIPLQAMPVQADPVEPADHDASVDETDEVGEGGDGAMDTEAAEAEALEPRVVQAVPVQARRVPAGDAGPLLADADELASNWPRLKAGFVDNPRGSVAEAASLVEDVAEALVAALRARQDQVRDTWDRDGRDTESLRQSLLTYQALFNRITGL